jgi:hypothetical protein
MSHRVEGGRGWVVNSATASNKTVRSASLEKQVDAPRDDVVAEETD